MSALTSATRSTLILARHAHTAMAGRFCGHIDPPLSPEGVDQLPVLEARLDGQCLTHIFSSDLQRARQTAASIAIRRNLPVHFLASLREIAFGDWEGLTWEEIVAQDPRDAQRWLDRYPSLPAPKGERLPDFRRRVASAMESIAEQVQGGCALVVTHAGVIRAFAGDLTGNGNTTDFKCGYVACWKLCREQHQWTMPEAVEETPALQVTAYSR